MTEPEWEDLRRLLCQQFDEDIVQQVILDLLEVLAKGVAIPWPLEWCRMRAKSRRIDIVRLTKLEQEAKAALQAFGVPYGTHGRKEKDRIRKRRKRRFVA